MHHPNIRRRLGYLPLLVLGLPVSACSDPTVNLGGGRIS
jgi:hypothetical protein